ncbi:MAG: RidA family protein [Phycisphaerales bacterium]|nr:RidA family protein [Phycisphaerales bacterium]
MSLRKISHPDAKREGPYSAAVEVDGWVYVSGQGPLDMATHKIIGSTIEEQTQLTLDHIDKVLKAAGCGPQDVVKCTCHLSDIADFDSFNSVYTKYFTGPVRPARTTVQSVLWGGIKVEIDAIARKK